MQDPPILPGLLLHSSAGVRAAALQLVAAMAGALDPADGFAYLLPQALPALTAAPADLASVSSLLQLLKPGASSLVCFLRVCLRMSDACRVLLQASSKESHAARTGARLMLPAGLQQQAWTGAMLTKPH